MRLFKQMEDFTIIADETTRFGVDEFVEKYEYVYSLLDGELATFSFRANKSRDNMLKKLRKTFEPEFNVIPGNHIFCVVKKIGV